jgi:hypothetical protein
MPAGGLLQLASCSDNKLLIDNLNFSHFKLVYKTSHPFSFQDLNIKFKGQNKFGGKHNLKIPNYGDLLQNLTMYCELPSLEARYNNDILTELRLNIDDNIFNLSTNNINYILERLSDFTYFTYFENENIINVYNWLDHSKELKKSTIYQKVKDYNIVNKNFVSPVYYDPNNVLKNELNQMCFNYVDKKNDLRNFYYPLQMQYLLHLLQVIDDRKIMTSYDYYQQFISKLTNYIVGTPEIQLIKYIEEKQQDYSLTSLDNQFFSENIIINLILNIYTTSNIEPLMYFFKKNGTVYELTDILVNKKYSVTNSNYIIKTEKYTNNDVTIENDVVTNTINNKIYFIGSRPQIIKSEDLFQILKIKFIKSRNNNISIYTSNPDEAIEWEIKILQNTSTINFPPLNDVNKYLMYIYNSVTPNEQDITDYQGKYIIDNSQKKYFVDKSDNYIPITFYIEDLSQLNINKSFIPVLLYSNLQSNIDMRYNKKYFLDKDMNFVLIKEIYIDENGNAAIIVNINDNNYFVDTSGNYIGPINSNEDISGNYIVDATADFIIDLIGNFTQDSSIQSQTDISNNLIPVYDFINKGKGFKYVYKGKYYNYLNLYYKNNYSKPSNLVDGFPYLLPFAILELSTYYNDLIILKKLNLPGISKTDLYYHTSEIIIRDNNTDKFAIYGNKFVNINDVDASNNIVNIVEDYAIQNQEVYLNNNFKYYWNNNHLIDSTDSIDYITYEYWQESNIASRFIIEANNINNYKFLPISNIKYENINYDVYENYKYIITKIKNLNLEDYEIYNIIVNNIGLTIDINHNIIKNIFTNLFTSNYFFSQYVITNANVIALQSKLVAEHANKYLESIIGTYDNNLFVEKILNNWNEFLESQDLLFFKTIQSANSSSYNIIKMLKNYETFPTFKIKIKQISNEILLKKPINLVLTNENDLSYNPIKISNLNYFDNNTNIRNFTNNTDYNNISINDINILKSLNIFTDNELNNLTFSFNKWTILEYDIIDEYYEMYIAPPDYIEFKKFLALLYFINTTNKLSFYVFFNITGSENIPSFASDKIRLIYNWGYFDDNYIVKNRSVNDVKNRIVFLNTIIIDFYKYLINKITSKIKNKQFLLYATIYFYNNLWHLIQDILHTIQKGYSTMSTLASAGNILIINNFSNYYDQIIVNHIITNLFNNYFDYNIKSKCINYLDGKAFNMNNKNIRFYSVLSIENANHLYTDIELTNLKSIEVLQWFVFYLSNKLELYYLPDRKPRASDIYFWTTFDNYKEQIFNGATLTHINFFLKYCQKEFTDERSELAAIYYAVNEVMMNIYDILNEEIINDKVNNTSYKIVTDTNKLFFGNIININNYSIFDILTEYLIQLFKQHYNNYTYNYLIEYFNVTKINFINFYRNIFDNVNTTGLTTYNLLRDIQIMTDFNWNNYDLIFPRINPAYNNLIDYNLQVSTTYSDAKFYFKYDLFFRNKIINFINDIYLHNQTLILYKYNKYKKLLTLNKVDELEIINNYNLTFGTNLAYNLHSTKEFKKVIEWEIFNDFGVDNNRLKIINNELGLYDNSNNKILDYTSIGIVNGNNILQYIIDGGMYKDTSNNLQPYFIHNFCVYSINLNAVNTPVYNYTINNGAYDSSNNLIFVKYNNLYYRVIAEIYEIINNKLIGTGTDSIESVLSSASLVGWQAGSTDVTVVEKIIYDKNTNIVHYLLNDLIPYNIKSAYDVSDNLTITNIINDVFENTITLNDTFFDINRQLQNPDYMTPILLNILLRNSILPCDQSWESLVLISFWNNILNYFGLNDFLKESINNYNKVNPCKQIKIINNTFYMDTSHTFSTFEDRDIIKNIHFSTEKEIVSKQELYSKLSTDELNVIQELNEVKLELNKHLINNICNNNRNINNNFFIINGNKYWYLLGELVTDGEKQLLDQLDWSIDQAVNTTLIILNGVLVRKTNLPFGFNYDFNMKLVKFDHKINNVLAMSYYKWNQYNFSPVEKKYKITNILEIISITQNTNENSYIYITINNHNLNVNDYIVVYKLNEIYGPMKILDVSNNILKIEVNDGFVYDTNYKYKIGIVDNYNYVPWQNYYKQNYTPIKISTDIIIILKTFFDNVITVNLPSITDVSSNFINVIENLTNLSNVINNFPADTDNLYNNITNISNNLISINKNLSFVPLLYNNMSNLMNVRDNVVNITRYTNYYSTILRNCKSMNITKINNVSNTIYNYASTLNLLLSNCDFFSEFLTNTNILKSLFYPLRKFFNEQNNGEIVNTINNLETIFNAVTLPNDLSENIILFVDNTKNKNSIYLTDISNAYVNLGLYSINRTEWRNMNREFDNYNNNIGNLYLINDISNNIFNFFNLNDIVQTNIQNITDLANILETYNIDNVINLLKNTDYLKNIIDSLHSLNNISDIINIFLQLGSPIDIIYRDISENINNIIDTSLNAITNDYIINKLTYIINNISSIKNKINESIVILNELSFITDISQKTEQLKLDILEIKNFMALFPIITTLARSIPNFEDIINDKNNNIPYTELYELASSTYDIINSFKTLYSGLISINTNLNLKTNSPIITKLNFITVQINKINEFNDLQKTVNILIDLMNTYASNNNSFDIVLYNNISLRSNIENFSYLFNNYFYNNITSYTGKLPTIYNLITNLPNINVNTIDINTINNHISYIQTINQYITNIETINFTYQEYTVASINFMYIIDNINNFIKLIDNIDELILLNTTLKDNTVNNTTIIYNNLNNIYDLLYMNLSLNALEYLIDNFLDFKYKIVQWYKKDNNSVFLVCRDDNNYLDYYGWVFLNNSNPLFIIDKYDLNYNNIKYKIIKIVWNDNEFIYDDTQTYSLQNGIGHILEKLNMYNILDTGVILDIYFTKINYNEIIKKYNKNLNKSYSVEDFKNYILNDIISSIDDNHPLINLPNNKISKIYNQHFNNFRFTNDVANDNNIITQYKINLQNKINNVIKLNNIINRPAKPRVSWIKFVGHYIFNKFNLRINDYTLQELSSDWLHIWSHCTINENKYDGYYKMIGNTKELYNFDANKKKKSNLYIPLPFYFQNKFHLALPLIALQNSQLIFEVNTRNINDLIYIEEGASLVGDMKIRFELVGSFVYLSDYERELFAKMRHEYLIEQVQYCYENISQNNNGSIKLNFFNPVKDMFFILQDKYSLINKKYHEYENVFKNISLNFNGHDRFSNVPSELTSLVYPHTYYETTFLDGLNVYPFCLHPLSYQPSGSCSFTYLNNKLFKYNLDKQINNGIIKIFARSYNILRITSGIGCIFI